MKGKHLVALTITAAVLGAVVLLRNAPMWGELRAHPRFQRLLERIGNFPAESSPREDLDA